MVLLLLGFLFWSNHYEQSWRVYCLHILFILMEFNPTTLKLYWLLITNYKAIHSHCDYNRHCSIIGLYYSCINYSIFNLNLRQQTANQPGFELGSQGLKAAMLTIELHSIDFNRLIKMFHKIKTIEIWNGS